MKNCTADAVILLILATLFTFTPKVYAQSTVKDTLKVKSEAFQQQFDFDGVAKRLSGLSKPVISAPQRDSFPLRIRNTVLKDLGNTHGDISLAYSYGLNTVFIDTSRSIGSILTTSGNFSTAILGLPINLSFNYSTLKVPLGTNNYFRIALDKDRLIQQQKEKLTGALSKIKDQEEIMKSQQAEVGSLLGYMEVYLDALKRRAEREAIRTKATSYINTSGMMDSLTAIDNDVSERKPTDKFQKEYDSVANTYCRLLLLKQKYDSISLRLASTQERISTELGSLSSPDLQSATVGKPNLLQSLKTLELGLSYPKTTALSNQNVPLKGLNVELQRGNYYVSVATGLTLNNVMLSTNEVQNQLNYSQNVFNKFDFQQIKNNGWLTAVKTGYGKVNGTHAFVGFNYLTNTRFLSPAGSSPSQTAYDPAGSVELDLRMVPKAIRGSAFDLVYGKTSMNSQLDTTSGHTVMGSLFSGYRSNLLLTRYNQTLLRLRTELVLTYRRLDAFANTTTFGTMQPNNERLEIKTDHRVNKLLKLGLLYRRDATLRSVMGMNGLRLNVAGLTLAGNYTSYLSYSVFFNHVHHQVRIPSLPNPQNGNNYLFGTNLNSSYKLFKAKANTMISYNDYLLTDSATVNKFTQFGAAQLLTENKYALSVSYDYFFKRIEGLSSGTSLFGASAKYILKKLSLSAGLKLACNFKDSGSLGGHFESQWQTCKFLDLRLRVERFVLGDFYRNYYRNQYEQFPYLITIQTTFKI